MKHHHAAWILIVAAVLFTAFPSLSRAEERFGPWVYYAPYYYPPNMVFAGRPFCPQDFAPRYESPNPQQPSNAAPPCMIAPQKRPVKVSSRGMHSSMRGSSGSYGKSSISTPYMQPRREERVDNLPSAAVHTRSAETSTVRPSTERPAATYLPPARPTPQLSSPGTDPNRYQPVASPSAQRTKPTIPDSTFGQMDVTDSAETPSTSSAPTQRPGIYSSPVDRSGGQSVHEDQTQSDSSSTKKPWTWGRKSPKAKEQQPNVTPSGQMPSGDQRL